MFGYHKWRKEEAEWKSFVRQQLEKIMATLQETLDAVNEESTQDDSIIALLQGLRDQIAAGGLSAADQATVDAIFAKAKENSGKIVAAVNNVP